MELPDFKALKKLTEACRKTGISSFECADFKITLVPGFNPISPYKRRKAAKEGRELPDKEFVQGDVPNSMPSEEDLLFAAVGGPPPEWDA